MDMAYLFPGIFLTFLIASVAYYRPIAEWIESFIHNNRSSWFVRFLSLNAVVVYYIWLFMTFISICILFLLLVGVLIYVLEYLGVIPTELEDPLSDIIDKGWYRTIADLFNFIMMTAASVIFILAMNTRRSYYLTLYASGKFTDIKRSSLFNIATKHSALFYYIFSLPIILMYFLFRYITGKYFGINFIQQVSLSYLEDVDPGLMVINLSLAHTMVNIWLSYCHLTYIKKLVNNQSTPAEE